MANTRFSTLKFKDFVCPYGNFIRLVWNGHLVYDDSSAVPELCSKKTLEAVNKKYSDKCVYSMHVNVVSLHHTELVIEGEE